MSRGTLLRFSADAVDRGRQRTPIRFADLNRRRDSTVTISLQLESERLSSRDGANPRLGLPIDRQLSQWPTRSQRPSAGAHRTNPAIGRTNGSHNRSDKIKITHVAAL